MLSKLFKKFMTIDFNEYYWAFINGEFYISVASMFTYTRKFLFFHWEVKGLQYLKTVKIPPHLFQLLVMFSRNLESEDPIENMVLTKLTDVLKKDTIAELLDMKEADMKLHDAENNKEVELQITKDYSERLLNIYDMFELSWTNTVIKGFLKIHWEFLFQDYAGVGTRDIWLARVEGDLIHIMQLKVLGSEKNNEVVLVEKLLLNKRLIDAYVLNALKGIK